MARQTGKLDRGDGVELAWAARGGDGPTVVFLPGLFGGMSGEIPRALEKYCDTHGLAYLSLDYSGHGGSDGNFADGSIGLWLNDALCVIDRLSAGKLLLVGHSMGGWIATLAALARKPRIAGLVGVAAAADFTETLIWQRLTPQQRAALEREGALDIPNHGGGGHEHGHTPPRVTRHLIEEGRQHLILNRPIDLAMPVRLLHGRSDGNVPLQASLLLAQAIRGEDVQVTIVKDGNHLMARPSDLDLLCRTVESLLHPLLLQNAA